MHLSHRLMFSLLGAVAAVSLAFAVYQARAEMNALSDEIQRQAVVLAESRQKSVEQILETGSLRDLQAVVDPYQNREHLAGMAIYEDRGQILAVTSSLAPNLAGTPPAVLKAIETGQGDEEYFRS